jgi:hypothetical protein
MVAGAFVYNPFADGAVTNSGAGAPEILALWAAAVAISAIPSLVVLAIVWASIRFAARGAQLAIQGPMLPLFGMMLFAVTGTLFRVAQEVAVGGWTDPFTGLFRAIVLAVPEYPSAGLAWGGIFWLLQPRSPRQPMISGTE